MLFHICFFFFLVLIEVTLSHFVCFFLVLEGDVNVRRIDDVSQLVALRIWGSGSVPRRCDLLSIVGKIELSEVGIVQRLIRTPLASVALKSDVGPWL